MERKILIPTYGPEAWRSFLASEKHWRQGYSAKTMAYCWEENNNFPMTFNIVFKTAGLNLEMLLALPEYKVYLDTKRSPSQNDLFVLSRDSEGLVVIMIEGKVSEPFNELIKDWNDSKGKLNRFSFLASKLEVNGNISLYPNIRYQLFHRTVSSILVAERFYAKKAIMLVHSFSQKNKWFDDYVDFIKILNPEINPAVDEINHCKTLSSGIELYLGWIKGDNKYLSKNVELN